MQKRYNQNLGIALAWPIKASSKIYIFNGIVLESSIVPL
jgi:hypothetical protein